MTTASIHRPRRRGRAERAARRLARTITHAAVRCAATTADSAAGTFVIWWLHNR